MSVKFKSINNALWEDMQVRRSVFAVYTASRQSPSPGSKTTDPKLGKKSSVVSITPSFWTTSVCQATQLPSALKESQPQIGLPPRPKTPFSLKG